jgi:predicted nucleic acid-binding protein
MLTEDIFVDTGAWVALADIKDTKHGKAASAYPSVLASHRRIITSNLIIAETYIILVKALGHAAATAFLERIHTSPRIARIYSTEAIESEAQAMLGKFRDHDFSYVDAVSFAIMKRQKIGKAFAFDKHFLTAGFLTVP